MKCWTEVTTQWDDTSTINLFQPVFWDTLNISTHFPLKSCAGTTRVCRRTRHNSPLKGYCNLIHTAGGLLTQSEGAIVIWMITVPHRRIDFCRRNPGSESKQPHQQQCGRVWGGYPTTVQDTNVGGQLPFTVSIQWSSFMNYSIKNAFKENISCKIAPELYRSLHNHQTASNYKEFLRRCSKPQRF